MSPSSQFRMCLIHCSSYITLVYDWDLSVRLIMRFNRVCVWERKRDREGWSATDPIQEEDSSKETKANESEMKPSSFTNVQCNRAGLLKLILKYSSEANYINKWAVQHCANNDLLNMCSLNRSVSQQIKWQARSLPPTTWVKHSVNV